MIMRDFYGGGNPRKGYQPVQCFHALQVEAQGVGGGSSLASWNVRVLNTEVVNTIPGATLQNNLIYLPIGKYWVYANGYTVRGDYSENVIRRVSDSVVVLDSYVAYYNDAGAVEGLGCPLFGQLNIDVADSFTLETRALTARATTGLGLPVGVGNEIYAEIFITRLQ